MKKICAVMIVSIMVMICATTALAGEGMAAEVPNPQLYDPEAFAEAWDQVVEGEIPELEAYVVNEETVDPMDALKSGLYAQYKIKHASNPLSMTYGAVSFYDMTDTEPYKQAGEEGWPQKTTYMVSSSDYETSEWAKCMSGFAVVLSKLTGDKEIIDWLMEVMGDYYLDYTKNSDEAEIDAAYEGDGFVIKAKNNIMFSAVFDILPVEQKGSEHNNHTESTSTQRQ